jgi:hypothetical protein
MTAREERCRPVPVPEHARTALPRGTLAQIFAHLCPLYPIDWFLIHRFHIITTLLSVSLANIFPRVEQSVGVKCPFTRQNRCSSSPSNVGTQFSG